MAKRISNSKSKAKQLYTKVLEYQTKKMEEKLSELKKFMEVQKKNRDEQGKMNESGSRWKAASSTAYVPLRNYAQKILDEQKEAMKKYLSNNKKLTGLKTIKQVGDKNTRKNEEQVQSQKLSESPKQTENSFNILGGIQLDNQPEPTIADKFGKAKLQQTTVVYEDRYVAQEPPLEIEIKHQAEYEYENDFELSYSEDKLKEYEEQPASTTNLLYGYYDYERNRRYFEYAVMAYRGVLQKIYYFSIQTEYKQQETAKVCFNCYKSTVESIQFLYRDFCSSKCLDRYKTYLTVSCATCHKAFVKLEGLCLDGIWFCSPGCNTNNAEMERLFIKWRMEEVKQNASFEDSLEA